MGLTQDLHARALRFTTRTLERKADNIIHNIAQYLLYWIDLRTLGCKFVNNAIREARRGIADAREISVCLISGPVCESKTCGVNHDVTDNKSKDTRMLPVCLLSLSVSILR